MAVRASMESLPLDIVQDIVSRVPADTVLECKLVCKRWETLICASDFAKLHLNRQLNNLHCDDNGNDILATKVEPGLLLACRTNDPDVFRTLLLYGGQLSDKICCNDEKYIYNQNLKRVYHPTMHQDTSSDHLVGSCNGLVCAFKHHNLVLDPIYISNPLTREYVYLPELIVKKEDIDPDVAAIDHSLIEEGEVNLIDQTACGFGYVKSTSEYKVVRIHYIDHREGNVEVYTLGSGCGWRALGTVCYWLDMWTGGCGTYANDAIYWTAGNQVVAFDLAKEEFRLLSGPPCLQNRGIGGGRCGLVALGGHLCLYIDVSRMEIWSLMKSNSKETWCMEFDIDYKAVVGSQLGTWARNFQPIILTKNREIIFLYNHSVLYCYDTKTTFLKMISDSASTDYFEKVQAIAHVNTFASLEAIGETSKRYTVRPRRGRTPWDDVIDELDRDALGEEIDTTRFRLK